MIWLCLTCAYQTNQSGVFAQPQRRHTLFGGFFYIAASHIRSTRIFSIILEHAQPQINEKKNARVITLRIESFVPAL